MPGTPPRAAVPRPSSHFERTSVDASSTSQALTTCAAPQQPTGPSPGQAPCSPAHLLCATPRLISQLQLQLLQVRGHKLEGQRSRDQRRMSAFWTGHDRGLPDAAPSAHGHGIPFPFLPLTTRSRFFRSLRTSISNKSSALSMFSRTIFSLSRESSLFSRRRRVWGRCTFSRGLQPGIVAAVGMDAMAAGKRGLPRTSSAGTRMTPCPRAPHLNTLYGLLSFGGVAACSLRRSGWPLR